MDKIIMNLFQQSFFKKIVSTDGIQSLIVITVSPGNPFYILVIINKH